MQIEIIPEPVLMWYTWSLAGSQGASFTLFPEKDSHNDDDVKKAKQWLRNNRDVVTLNIEWLESGSQREIEVYNAAIKTGKRRYGK
jgi:hypothetical protein